MRGRGAGFVAAVLLLIGHASADPFKILHRFQPPTGYFPLVRLTLVNEKLYGTTAGGGAFDRGVLFSINLDGSDYTVRHSFAGGNADGAIPWGRLTLVGPQLYGTTFDEGRFDGGSIYSINPDGTNYSTRFWFPSPQDPSGTAHPRAGVTVAGSKLYGTTGPTDNVNIFPYPAVYSVNPDGSDFRRLHTFFSGPPQAPESPQSEVVVVGTRIYGTVTNGPLYSMTLDGLDYKELYRQGGFRGGLTQVGNKLFGATNPPAGLNSQGGTLFSINLDGTGLTTLHTFTGGKTDGSHPWGDLVLVGSTLFGITERGGAFSGTGVEGGTIFSIELDGSGYKIWHHFTSDGWNPRGGLTLVGNTLYGINHNFGRSDNDTIFALQIPEPGELLLLGAVVGFLRRRSGRLGR